jgi:CRP-like cAMP-binding protein
VNEQEGKKMRSVVPPVRSGATAPLTQKLSQYIPLGPDEISVLLELQSGSRFVRRGQEIIIEGRISRTLFIVMEGVAIRYRILRNGRRHVLNVLLPGDIAGIPDCFFESTLYSIKTIIDSWVAPVPRAHVMNLVHTHPQLAAKLFFSSSCEAAIYAEHLITVGRRSALERVAHFLLELLTRLQGMEGADERSFCLPLTQELIADTLGLSIPYVNRVLCSLRDEDLVRVKGKIIVINDAEALSAFVDFDRNYLKPLSITDLLDDAQPKHPSCGPSPSQPSRRRSAADKEDQRPNFKTQRRTVS